jgi:hypothetical protein
MSKNKPNFLNVTRKKEAPERGMQVLKHGKMCPSQRVLVTETDDATTVTVKGVKCCITDTYPGHVDVRVSGKKVEPGEPYIPAWVEKRPLLARVIYDKFGRCGLQCAGCVWGKSGDTDVNETE